MSSKPAATQPTAPSASAAWRSMHGKTGRDTQDRPLAGIGARSKDRPLAGDDANQAHEDKPPLKTQHKGRVVLYIRPQAGEQDSE